MRRYWADLHGQSGETIGMGSAEAYFRYARDCAFVDMVGHQGNDFQITDAFWKKLNELTAEFDKPGKFVCLPGYEWSGNTGMGGDRNIFYRHEGRPIRRSSHILVEGQTSTDAIYTADKLFEFLKDEDCGRDRPCRRPLRRPEIRPRRQDSSAPSRCIRAGARSNGSCTTRSRRAIASAWSATATTTRAGLARRGPALRPSARSAGCPATSCRS